MDVSTVIPAEVLLGKDDLHLRFTVDRLRFQVHAHDLWLIVHLIRDKRTDMLVESAYVFECEYLEPLPDPFGGKDATSRA